MKERRDRQKEVRCGRYLWIYLFCLILVSTAWAQGEGKEGRDILVIGTGLVVDENLARARSTAVTDALNKAVEQYILRRLGMQGTISHFPRLVQDVISTENREIETFTIIAEERVARTLKALVRVRINERVMDQRFREHALVITREKPMNVVFLVSQVEHPEARVSYWWASPEDRIPLSATELALHQAFEDLGFFAANRLMRSLEGRYGAEMTAPDLSPDEALKWGEVFSVPVVILGRCEVVGNKEVHLSLLAAGTGSRMVIGQDSQSEIASDEGIARVMERAARSIALRLGPAIRKAVESREIKTSRIEIMVRGLRSYRELKIIKEALEREVEGVNSVTQSSLGGDFVRLMVDFSGSRQEFVDRLSERQTLPFAKDAESKEDEPLIFRVR